MKRLINLFKDPTAEQLIVAGWWLVGISGLLAGATFVLAIVAHPALLFIAALNAFMAFGTARRSIDLRNSMANLQASEAALKSVREIHATFFSQERAS